MYRCVVAMFLCPASAIITRTLTPFSAKTDDGIAKVHVTTWRRNVEINITGNESALKAASKKLVMAGLGK